SPEVLARNFEALRKFVSHLPAPEIDPVRRRNGGRSEWQGYLWQYVPAADVVDFLRTYRTHPDAYRVNSPLLAEFIDSMTEDRELTAWTVALIGGGVGRSQIICADIQVQMLERKQESGGDSRYSIKRLMSPRDEAIDLEEEAWNAALTVTRQAWHADASRNKGDKEPDAPSGPAIRKLRGFGAPGVPATPHKGVLALYVLDPLSAGSNANFPSDTPPIVAFGISFPGSNSGR